MKKILAIFLPLIFGMSSSLFASSTNCFERIGVRSPSSCVNSVGIPSPCNLPGSVPFYPSEIVPADVPSPPLLRDSTSWLGRTIPQTRTGDEHFNWIKVIEDRAYIAHFNGFSIWDLSCDLSLSSCPRRLAVREIFSGHWAFSQFAGGELYLITHSLDALKTSNGKIYVAVTGQTARIGLSIWDVTNPLSPRQIYQDYDRDGYFVKLHEINGRPYAFYAGIEAKVGQAGGVSVYDINAALTASQGHQRACIENTLEDVIECPGVFRGGIGTYSRGRSLDLETFRGKTYVAHAAGLVFMGMTFSEILDPAMPSFRPILEEVQAGQAFHGPDLFTMDDRLYLSFVRGTRFVVEDLTSCTSGGGNCVPIEIFSVDTELSGEDLTTTYSSIEENGKVSHFVYVGGTQRCLSGTNHEYLFNLTDRSDVYDVFRRGASAYTDPGNGKDIDYAGHYYAKNTSGFNNAGPRMAIFQDRFLLRMMSTFFDKHRYIGEVGGTWEPPPPPPVPSFIFSDGFESGDTSKWDRVSSPPSPEPPILSPDRKKN